MKCQNCGSNDVVGIQGEQYCLNCGEAVVSPPPEPVAATQVATVAPPITKNPRVLNRAKAPKALAPAVAPPEIVAPVEPKPKRSFFRKKEAPVAPADATTVTYKEAAAPRKEGLRPTSQRSIDHGVSQRREQPVRAAAADETVDPVRPLHVDPRVHPLRFTFKTVLTTALALGVATAASVWLKVDSDIGWFLIGGGIIIAGIILTLAQAALLYGFTHYTDIKPPTHTIWWAAARNGFMDIVNVNLIVLIKVALVGGVDFFANQAIVNQWGSTYYVMGALLIMNMATVWVLGGLYVAKRMAVPAVVIGGLDAVSALKIGWKFYLQAGGHLIGAALEILLVRTLAAAIIAAGLYVAIAAVPTPDTAVVALTAGVLAGVSWFLFGFALLEVEMRLWLRQYRQWITLLPNPSRQQLASGRLPDVTTASTS